jgi:hypothetical protein
MRNLENMFGSRLEILSVDQEWLNFQVLGLTPSVLILQLQNQEQALLGSDAGQYQVLAPTNPSAGAGISIRWVGHRRDEILPGFWFY